MAFESPTAGVLPFPEARRIVEEQAAAIQPPQVEAVALERALGRVLAEPVHADRDFPPFRRAARDGYALRSADLAQLPAKLKVVGEVRAGASLGRSIERGEAAEIMTGAPTPDGADAIVMVEYTARHGDTVEVQRPVNAGENVAAVGSEGKAGTELLGTGTRLGYAQIAAAAATGKAELKVFTRPSVAVLSTGDELVEVRETPGPDQIRNSNSYSLAAQVEAAGAVPVRLPIARDDAAGLHTAFAQGLRSDLLLLTGGVSMGKYDLAEDVLRGLGAEFFFTGALIQPGRPIVFGRIGKRYFFGLPGNPVSTMVTFELFVRPLLEALCGARPRPLRFLLLPLKSEVRTRTGLTRFLPALLSGESGQTQVELAGWQGSGDIATAARSDCYIVVPPDRDRIPAGEMVSVLMM